MHPSSFMMKLLLAARHGRRGERFPKVLCSAFSEGVLALAFGAWDGVSQSGFVVQSS